MSLASLVAAIALAALPAGRAHQTRMHPMAMAGSAPGWTIMSDGAVTLMANRQGGPRGVTEVRAPNWWMGMASHALGPGRFTGQAMFSLDPATVGKCGYAELFQAGETCNGRPLVDRQHPHDLTSQLALIWRIPIADRTSITMAGGPVGEPALGPVAFMHRPSAADNPVAPLSHHTFDSTHVAMGVATVAIAHSRVALEASVFNGREPDENRWNLLDRGRWDSWSARFWYRPGPEWQLQVSTGHLVAPEALEPGNIRRTTASAAWFRERENGFTAIEAGYGRNDKARGTSNAVFLEATERRPRVDLYARFEALEVESAILAGGRAVATPVSLPVQAVVALTGGALRRLGRLGVLDVGIGADVTAYRVPPDLVASHGAHPVSFHVFLSVRPHSKMARMWNTTMTGVAVAPAMPHEEMPSMPRRPETAPTTADRAGR